MKCVNCGRDRPEADCSTLVLTEDERNVIRSLTGDAPVQLVFCKPCYRVITDREMGARLISGQLEARLRIAGNPKAQQIAETLYKFLIDKSKSKQVS
jgi:hypothetical protein